jgi:hypothetical protein
MRLEVKKFLCDIEQAADLLAQFTAGKTFADYGKDAMLRAASEREFEIIGEALAKLAQLDAALAERISEQSHHCISQHLDSRLRQRGRPAGLGHHRNQAAHAEARSGEPIAGSGGNGTVILNASDHGSYAFCRDGVIAADLRGLGNGE